MKVAFVCFCLIWLVAAMTVAKPAKLAKNNPEETMSQADLEKLRNQMPNWNIEGLYPPFLPRVRNIEQPKRTPQKIKIKSKQSRRNRRSVVDNL